MPKTGESESVTLRMPVEVLEKIETIAEATERSRSYIIVRALKTYLMNEGADILAAAEGRQEIANGDSVDIVDVIADMDRIIAGKVA